MTLANLPKTNQIATCANNWQGLIETYRPYLPVTDTTPVVTLLEGNTPLIPVPAIAKKIRVTI